MTTKTKPEVEFRKLKVGDVLSETQFYTVDKIVGSKTQVTNDSGEPIVLTKDYVETCLHSANQHRDTVKMTRTELAELFISATRVAITVNFHKQVKPADVKKALHALYPNKGKIISEASFKKQVNAALNLKGEERTMIGRHYGHVDDFGRVNFIDMKAVRKLDADYDSRSRLVDPRTINWVIVNGVKYEVK